LGTQNDLIIVGFVAQINDPENITTDYPLGIPIVDLKNLSKGNSHVTTVYGGTEDDQFEVNHNSAKLYLSGEAGDDTFVVNTFLVLTDSETKDIANLTTLFGGAGNNRYTYLQNAPVFISGGAGIDTIVINGTPIGDLFIVTDKYVVGAGRVVYFTGIERLEINSAGGDDDIYILSSNADLEITVRGGSGNDEVHLGGDPPPLIFDPPPFSFQPPSYQVQDAPVDVVLPFTLNLGWIAFNTSSWSMSNSLSTENIASAILNILNYVIWHYSGFLPGLRPAPGTDLSQEAWNFAVGPIWTYTWYRHWIWGRETGVIVDLSGVQLEYDGKVLPPLRTVVPDRVDVDPPPFAFKQDASFTLDDIKGRITIDGGIGSESAGDTLFVHSEGATNSLTGRLTSTVVPNLSGEQFQVYEKTGQSDILVSLDASFTANSESRVFSDGGAGTITRTIYSASQATSNGYTPALTTGLVELYRFEITDEVLDDPLVADVASPLGNILNVVYSDEAAFSAALAAELTPAELVSYEALIFSLAAERVIDASGNPVLYPVR